MIVVDTTILVYAAGGEHALREPCRRLFDAVVAGRVSATTTAPVIQEFLHVRSRRHDRAEACRQASRFDELLTPLLRAPPEHVGAALALFEAHVSLDALDAFLVAAALEADARALVSADPAFAGLPGLRYVYPATPELDALLRA